MDNAQGGSAARKAVLSMEEAIAFVKMQGCGNHFVVIDARYGLPLEGSELSRVVCNPNFGIGADGLILIESSLNAEFRMSYFNPDGSTTTCGNGLRCVARFIHDHGLLSADEKSFELETPENIARVTVLGGGGRVRVDMGEPEFEGSAIPLSSSGEHLEHELKIDDATFSISAVSMGNPHCVILVEDLESFSLDKIGPKIEANELFPEKTNVEIVSLENESRINVRIWERGVGETFSCGTGICASVAALVRLGKCDRLVSVNTKGGEVEVSWNETSGRIFLTGPADVVYRGEFVLADSMQSYL